MSGELKQVTKNGGNVTIINYANKFPLNYPFTTPLLECISCYGPCWPMDCVCRLIGLCMCGGSDQGYIYVLIPLESI
jgi:hypothetical protein